MQLYTFPNSVELSQIDQNLLPVFALQDPIFAHFPVKSHDAAHVSWEQKDDYRGLMQVRGYEGEFPLIPGVGVNRFNVDPGVYGEGAPVTEQEITERRQFGSLGTPIPLGDLVKDRHMMLMTRHWNRMSQILWTLLVTGTFVIANTLTGAVAHMDAYAPQTYTAGTTWATTTTATPLADFRAVTLLHRGHSVTFAGTAVAYMNRKTFNNLIGNSNTADLGGRRSTGLETIEGLAQYNALALKDDLPMIMVYDEGYLSDGITDSFAAGSFNLFIPDNIVVVIGRRLNGAPLGEFCLTRNAQNPNVGPGYMVKVVDTGASENTHPPRKITVYRGFNGGPKVDYASSVCVMSV